MIKNVCATCSSNIEVEQPIDEEGDIDWMLVRMLKNSTVSVCNICDSKSSWKRSN